MLAEAMAACRSDPWGIGGGIDPGVLGRLSQLVGGVCGLLVGLHAVSHILRSVVLACVTWLGWHVLAWMIG